MARLAATVACVAFSFASARPDLNTPVQKVLTLLKDLKLTAIKEGETEAASYATFATWCFEQTGTQTTTINKGTEDIGTLSAGIKSATADHGAALVSLARNEADKSSTKQDLEDATNQHEVDDAKLGATLADLGEAIGDLLTAKKHLQTAPQESTPIVGRLVQLQSAAITAQQFGMGSAQKLVQVIAHKEPYDFHSDDIITLLDQLVVEFGKKETTAAASRSSQLATFKAKKGNMEAAIISKVASIVADKETINSKVESIATDREKLIIGQKTVEDANLYLKDLTKTCENKANTFDQRAMTRHMEVDSINGAMDILKGDAKTKEAYRSVGTPSELVSVSKHIAPVSLKLVSVSEHIAPVSLLQLSGHDGIRQLRGSHTAAKPELVANMLSVKGKQIGSTTLLSLSSQLMEAGPFTKVKQLIQTLIERLLTESKNEVTKEFWCKEEMVKNKKELEYRHEKTQKLSIEIQALSVTKEQLQADIGELDVSLEDSRKELEELGTVRGEEKKENSDAISDAKAGLIAVKKAIFILQDFYKQAAKAFVQTGASPIYEGDDSAPDAGFSGTYQGKQAQAGGIFGLLEVIQTDFERTIRKTAQSEKEAKEDNVKTSRSLKVSRAGDKAKKDLNGADERETNRALTGKTTDLKDEQKLVDLALKEIEALTPTCVDFRQSHAERTEKRQEEIVALKNALCHLDPLETESSC